VAATILVAGCILVFALWLPLTALAKITAFIMLVIFALLNFSLVVIKLRREQPQTGVTQFPLWCPAVGFLLCVGLIAFQLLV